MPQWRRDILRANPPIVLQHNLDETRLIELWPCGYDARCNVKHCKAKATLLARSVDAGRTADEAK
jgi:hypothetical protein